MFPRPEISTEEQERIVTVLVSILKLLRQADPKLEDCLFCSNRSEDDILVSLPTCGHVLGIRCLVEYLSSHGTTCPICSRDCQFEETLDESFSTKTIVPCPTSAHISVNSSLRDATDAFDQTLDRVDQFLEKLDAKQTQRTFLWNPPKDASMVHLPSSDIPTRCTRRVYRNEPELTIESSKLWSSNNSIKNNSPFDRADSNSQINTTSSESPVLSVKSAMNSIPLPPSARPAGIQFMVQRARVMAQGSSTDSLSKRMGFGTSPNRNTTLQNSSRGGFMSCFSRKPPAETKHSLDAHQQITQQLKEDQIPPPQPPSEVTPEMMIKVGQEPFQMAADAATEKE